MPQQFVRIVNRGTYTNAAKAQTYVKRKLAEEFFVSLSRQILEIRMLESAELAIVRSYHAQAKREATLKQEQALDDAMIEHGRRVVFWNADDPEGRHLPGTVRS